MAEPQGCLEENLSYIRRYNKRIDATLPVDVDLSVYSLGESESGDPILFYRNIPLNCEKNPAESAAEKVDTLLGEDNMDAIHILVGIGTGYDFKAFVEKLKGKVILFEPKPNVLKMVLNLVDFSEELCRRNVIVAANYHEVVEAVSSFYKEDCKISFSILDAYDQLTPKFIGDIESRILELVPEKYEGGPLKLNIGPGTWGKKGWKKLDCYNPMTNFDVDLRKITKLPLMDNVLEKVFSSHCIEHIEDSHLDILISELFRCMAPGGLLRLSCPDADQALDAYKNGDTKWFYWLPQDTPEKMLLNTFVSYERGGPRTDDEIVKEKFASLDKEEFIRWCVSQVDRTRPYIAHINGHYFDKMYKKLTEVGFVDVKRSTYQGSEDEELRGEKFDLYPDFSLYVECKKPL